MNTETQPPQIQDVKITEDAPTFDRMMNVRFTFAAFLLALLMVAGAQTSELEAPHPTTVEMEPTIDMLHRCYAHWFVASAGFGITRMGSQIDIHAQMQARADILAFYGTLAIPGLSTGKPWPPTEVTIDGADYQITSVQLISLLKHDPPAAYVPRLVHTPVIAKAVASSGADGIPVRDLNEFEKSALTQLRQGANLVHMGNEKILGAIRAQASCVACHDVDEGALLGAFSYVLEKEKTP